jgi:hypothetical protein
MEKNQSKLRDDHGKRQRLAPSRLTNPSNPAQWLSIGSIRAGGDCTGDRESERSRPTLRKRLAGSHRPIPSDGSRSDPSVHRAPSRSIRHRESIFSISGIPECFGDAIRSPQKHPRVTDAAANEARFCYFAISCGPPLRFAGPEDLRLCRCAVGRVLSYRVIHGRGGRMVALRGGIRTANELPGTISWRWPVFGRASIA